MNIKHSNETQILTAEDKVLSIKQQAVGEKNQINLIHGKSDVAHYLTRQEARRWKHLPKSLRNRMIRREQQKAERTQAACICRQDTITARKEYRKNAYIRKKHTALQTGKRNDGLYHSVEGSKRQAASVPSENRQPAGISQELQDAENRNVCQQKQAGCFTGIPPEEAQYVSETSALKIKEVESALFVSEKAAASAASSGGSEAVQVAVKAAKKTAETFRQTAEYVSDGADRRAGNGAVTSVSQDIYAVGDKFVNKIIQAGAVAAAVVTGAITSATKPFVMIIMVMVFLVSILIPNFSLLGVGGYQGVAHVTPQVEFYRPYLEKYAALYPGMEKLVDLMLAMIMQEAGGESWIGTMDGDIMQSSESAGYPGPGYLTGEASIAQGVKYLAEGPFKLAGLLEDPYNLDKTKLAIQGYNYGVGYVPWALNNYGGYTEENAAIFSDMMAARLGWSAYGDKQYVQHVLRYYEIKYIGFGISVSTKEITHAETRNRLEELSASWPLDLEDGRKEIIKKGCTLAGFTTYDMYGADTRSGKDLPRTLDCSSFVAWCFQKCGYRDVPYWSTTGTFLGAANFRQISASDLKPGDIGLINWVASGGSNHVGIFVGRDANGQAMWLHCTSRQNSGSSIVTGPRISYYSAFSLFFRYTGF